MIKKKFYFTLEVSKTVYFWLQNYLKLKLKLILIKRFIRLITMIILFC